MSKTHCYEQITTATLTSEVLLLIIYYMHSAHGQTYKVYCTTYLPRYTVVYCMYTNDSRVNNL